MERNSTPIRVDFFFFFKCLSSQRNTANAEARPHRAQEIFVS